jgi:hypothetical protein
MLFTGVRALAFCGLLLISRSEAASSMGQVISVQDPNATEAFRAKPDVVRNMVSRGLAALTGKSSDAEAWATLITTQDVIGIKIYSVPGPNSGTRSAVVAAVVEGLLAAGVPPKHVIVWDREALDLRLAGFFQLADRYGVQVRSSLLSGFDGNTYYESSLMGNLVWGDYEFGKRDAGTGRRSFVSKLVSREITKLINVTPLLNHNVAGVSGNLYGLASGSVDNFTRFEYDPVRLATAVPEIYALPAVGDKVVLNIVDALICQYEGGERGLLHYSVMLNELRFSKDPVALDVLSIQELDRQRDSAKSTAAKNLELYKNAALLELGVSDPKKIQVETLKLGSRE